MSKQTVIKSIKTLDPSVLISQKTVEGKRFRSGREGRVLGQTENRKVETGN